MPLKYPVQAEIKLTPKDIARINLRRWLDNKRVRDAEREARKGMTGYPAGAHQ